MRCTITRSFVLISRESFETSPTAPTTRVYLPCLLRSFRGAILSSDVCTYHHALVFTVSNHAQFASEFKAWHPGKPLIHPHPYFKVQGGVFLLPLPSQSTTPLVLTSRPAAGIMTAGDVSICRGRRQSVLHHRGSHFRATNLPQRDQSRFPPSHRRLALSL